MPGTHGWARTPGRLTRRLPAFAGIAVAAALVVPAGASAAVTCDVLNDGSVDIRLNANFDIGQIDRAGANIAVRSLTGPVTCVNFAAQPVTPAIGTIPNILVSTDRASPDAPRARGVAFIIDDANGLASATTFVNFNGDPTSLLSVRAGRPDFPGHFIFGTDGVDTDPAAGDGRDIRFTSVLAFDGRGNFTNPVNFSAEGGGDTGGPVDTGIRFVGSTGSDVLVGAGGADDLESFAAADTLVGRGGNDRLAPGSGNDSVDGGPGSDTVDYFSITGGGVAVDLALTNSQPTIGSGNDRIVDVENVQGTPQIDVLRGDAGPNVLTALNGPDRLDGRGGSDTLLAGSGDDEITSRDGAPDTVDCGDGTDSVTADRQGVDILLNCETVAFAPQGAPPGQTPPRVEPGADPTADPPAIPLPPGVRAAAITSMRVTPSAFRALTSGPSARSARRRPRPRGAVVSLRLNTAAVVTYRVARRVTGRRVGRRCVAATRANRGRPRCARLALVRGSFRRAAGTGANRFRFSGRIGGRALRPGRYQLRATPRAGGRNGPVARASFSIASP